MGTLIPFNSNDADKEHDIYVNFRQGGLDGRGKPIVLLSRGHSRERTVVPYMVVNELFRLVPHLFGNVSPEIQLLVMQMSQSAHPSEEQLHTLASLIVHGDEHEIDESHVVSLATQVIARQGDSPQKIIEGLRGLQNSQFCPQLLSEFIGKLLDQLEPGDQVVDETRANTRTSLHATLEYGTRSFTSPDDHSYFGEVVLAFRKSFASIIGVARGKIYHPESVEVLLRTPELRFHRNARLKLAIPLIPVEEDPQLAKEILLEKLLVGGHLDREKTSAVLDEKMLTAEVIIPDINLRQITLRAQDLVQCGLSETALFPKLAS